MYALWTPNKYTIEYEGNKPTLGSTYVDYLPGDAACKYDEDVTLAAAPTLPGYTFGGWYFDNKCTQKAGDAGETLPMANLASEEGAVVKLYAKWTANTYKLILNANGGTIQQTEIDVVFDSPIPELETPVRDGFAFLEWVLPDGATLTTPANWTYAEDVTVTAKWLKTRQEVTFRIGYKAANRRVDSDNLVTDTDKVYEQILPGMDKEALIKKGYNKLSIKVHMWLYEANDGDKTIWLKPYYDHTNDDKRTALVQFTSSKGKWNEHTFSFDLQNLTSDLFNDDCMFYIEYGAHGNAGDDWYLGDTWITIEAVK
jgi:hypothetical protein